MAQEHHFDLGNSNTGPIGFCAVITADTPEEALAILKENLPEELLVDANLPGDKDYIQVYFNDEAITLKDNDYSEDLDEEEEDDGEEDAEETPPDARIGS